VAAAHPGAPSNFLADPQAVDALSGNAVLNGIPVTEVVLGIGDTVEVGDTVLVVEVARTAG